MGFSAPVDGGRPLDLGATAPSERPVIGVTVRYPKGHIVPMHQHGSGHLIYADRGLLRVETETGQWLVPPTSAVWLRSGVRHQLIVPIDLQAHGIFIREDLCARLPASNCVIQVSGLAKELIMSLANAVTRELSEYQAHLQGELLIEELRCPPPLPFHLPWPDNAQMQTVCQALMADPGKMATADDWASRLAISGKTFHRRFLQSTGMTFGKWRQQLRLMASLALLMQGVPITQIASVAGYDSHSAYTVAFKKHFGRSPTAFAAAAH